MAMTIDDFEALNILKNKSEASFKWIDYKEWKFYKEWRDNHPLSCTKRIKD
jgi:hypothetical protein